MRLQLPESIIADTAAAVFRAAEYARARPSPLVRAYRWLRDLVAPVGESTTGSGPIFWWLVAAGAIVVALVVGRAIYLGRLRSAFGASDAPRGSASRARVGARDPWRTAEELAASGDFTRAAHSLYQALLESVARRERVSLHPAMTVGDYARILRARSSSLFTRFREFAQSYETVIYGSGTCDRERYERLRTLALPILQADG